MASFGVLNRLLKQALPDEDPSRVSHALLEGLPGVVSVGSVVDLWDLAVQIGKNPRLRALIETTHSRDALERIRTDPGFREFRLRFERYLEDWGFRCPGELMLTVPSFQERPGPLIDLLRSYLGMETRSPRAVIEACRQRSLAETRRVIERLTGHRALGSGLFGVLLFRAVVRATHGSIRYRERARLKQALIYSHLRRVVLALGERLVESGEIFDREDVFFLTHEELEDLLSGRSMFPGCTSRLVAFRKKAHGEIARTKPPATFTLSEGAYAFGGARAGACGEMQAGTHDGLSGVSACGGRAVGQARVLRDATEAHVLGREDVLVTEQTDPGWGPAFFIVRGLVMERGGVLSHGAILAREFGIPAVVGVEGATRRIPDRARIVVQGDAGRVDLVD